MKKQSAILFAQLGEAHVKAITTIVKETLQPGFTFPGKKVFTSAQLWSIQRLKKGMIQRRYIY